MLVLVEINSYLYKILGLSENNVVGMRDSLKVAIKISQRLIIDKASEYFVLII